MYLLDNTVYKFHKLSARKPVQTMHISLNLYTGKVRHFLVFLQFCSGRLKAFASFAVAVRKGDGTWTNVNLLASSTFNTLEWSVAN